MERFDERLVVNEDSGNRFYQVIPCEDGKFVLYADAQATVEALQRGRDEDMERIGKLCEQVADLERKLRIEDAASRVALDAEREKVKIAEGYRKDAVERAQHNANKAQEYQQQLSQLQALLRAVSDTMEPFRKSMAKLDEVDTLATRRIAEADAYYCAQRVLTTLDALTPAGGGTR